MNTKIKEFFKNAKRGNGGFTLVELIITIAIVAILGGVAVPAYSGYIAKADAAADAQLLGDINKAFAAACLVEGLDNYKLTSATAEISEEGKLVNVTADSDAEFYGTFDNFFDNEGAFKKTTELKYEPSKGGFVDPNAGEKTKTYNFGGLKITLNADDVAILSGDNAFSDRGSEALLADVGALQTYLAGGYIGEEILDEIGTSDDFYFAMGGYLGMKREDYADDDAYMAAVGKEVDRLKVTNPNIATNALIMYSASHAANASQDQIDKLFTGTVTGNIAVRNPDGSTNNEATMANAALAYGMYTAYMQRYPNGDAAGNKDFVNVITSDEFEGYYATDDAKTDLAAYMAAMNMVSDNTGNSEITSSILENGIVNNTTNPPVFNQDLAALMKDVMGK